jgi:hypothetical protein
MILITFSLRALVVVMNTLKRLKRTLVGSHQYSVLKNQQKKVQLKSAKNQLTVAAP